MVAFPITFPQRIDFLYSAIYEGAKIHTIKCIPHPGWSHTFELEWSPSLQDKAVCIMGFVRGEEGPVFEHAVKIRDLFPHKSNAAVNCRLAHKLLLGTK